MKSFKESQNMFAIWLLFIMVPIIGFQMYQELSNPINLLSNPAILITAIIIVFFVFIRLKTNYTPEGIHVVFIPFIWKKFIPWDDISNAYLRKYSLSDFGGWGYRFGKDGRAFTAKGDKGLQLVLKDNSKLLIGTQEPEEIQKIINLYKPYQDEF